MVIPFSLGSFGLNLQNCCHHGIVLEEPLNTGSLLQALGRIARMGQMNRVEWEILYTPGTFDGFRLSMNLEKHVRNLAAEAHLDESITNEGEIAKICLHELAAIQLGLPFNAYIFARVPWHAMDEPATRDECRFYSAVAQAVIVKPKYATLLDKEKLDEIVKRWEVGGPLTRGIMNGTAPLVENPVKLRHYDDQRRPGPQLNSSETLPAATPTSMPSGSRLENTRRASRRDRDSTSPAPRGRKKRRKYYDIVLEDDESD